MTIDEAIKSCEARIYALRNSKKRSKMEGAKALTMVLKELKWYREQDLVKREDVLKVYDSDLCLDFDIEMCASTPNCRCCIIMRIPKAEPHKE